MDARSDPWVFRIVVLFVGGVALVATAGGVLLSINGHEFPAALMTLGGTAIGALSGLLAALLGGPTGQMHAENVAHLAAISETLAALKEQRR